MYVVPTIGVTAPSLRSQSRETVSRGPVVSSVVSRTQKPVVAVRGANGASGTATSTWYRPGASGAAVGSDTVPVRNSAGPSRRASPANSSRPAPSVRRTVARAGTASPARGTGRFTTTRTAPVSPASSVARSGRASTWPAPSRARRTSASTSAASRVASDGASTQRAPASAPRRRSMASNGQARGRPRESTTWTSGRSTPSRTPSEPPSLAMSFRVASRTVSSHVRAGSGVTRSQPEPATLVTVAGPAMSPRATVSAGPICSSWANVGWRVART